MPTCCPGGIAVRTNGPSSKEAVDRLLEDEDDDDVPVPNDHTRQTRQRFVTFVTRATDPQS